MQPRVGHAVVESIAAESPKFTAPMVLVHGLWCTAAIWRRCMGYLAHRGWSCHALNLRGHADAVSSKAVRRAEFLDYLSDVQQVIAACAAPPVVVGHDLGGLLALHCAAPPVRAVVALAPLVGGALATRRNRAVAGLAARLAMLRASTLPVPRGKIGAAYFAQSAPGGMVADSALVARAMQRDDFRTPPRACVPTLLLAGERDSFSPPSDVQRLASAIGGAFQVVDGGGHALPWETGWEQRVSEIHRWLVRILGEPLLLPRAEEEE